MLQSSIEENQEEVGSAKMTFEVNRKKRGR